MRMCLSLKMMWNNGLQKSRHCTSNKTHSKLIFTPVTHREQITLILPLAWPAKRGPMDSTELRNSQARHWEAWLVKTVATVVIYSNAVHWFINKQHQHSVTIPFFLFLFILSSDWAILISCSGSLRSYFETILDGTPNMWSDDQYAPTPFMPKPLYSCSQRVNSTSIQDFVKEYNFAVKYKNAYVDYFLITTHSLKLAPGLGWIEQEPYAQKISLIANNVPGS